MLLSWGTLQPHGNSKLASIRFASPVKIKSLRLYPNGHALFSSNPDAIGYNKTFLVGCYISNSQLAAPNRKRLS